MAPVSFNIAGNRENHRKGTCNSEKQNYGKGPAHSRVVEKIICVRELTLEEFFKALTKCKAEKYDRNDWLRMCYTVTHSFNKMIK
ncbi:hypothetical protein LXL04_006093 [Taraxacum kok-saghyz]